MDGISGTIAVFQTLRAANPGLHAIIFLSVYGMESGHPSRIQVADKNWSHEQPVSSVDY